MKRLDAGKIRRQLIDIDTRSVPFPEQRRCVAAEPLVYMH